jgi:Phosphotransferase enzyme family
LGTEATVRGQFEELEALNQLHLPGLNVPKALALVPEKRLFIMEFVPGAPITALLSSRARAEEGLRACELAGAVLARLHRAWREAVCPLPIEQLAEDIATIPWRLSRGQNEMLRTTLAQLTGARASLGRMHYDYEPDNLLLDGERLFLIDPSTGCHRGIQLFEVATFGSALRRRLFMRWTRQPFNWRRGLLEQAIAQFQQAYLAEGGGADLEPRLFVLAIRLFELQRLGQMFAYQTAKIEMARQKGQFGWQVGGLSTNRAQLELLDLYKGWLFRELDLDLRSAK